jgi:4,4'-diaponeurosporenoate glycosyltransferase
MNTEGILLTITLALWSAGWLVLGRVRRCGLGDVGKSISSGRLSIIIPARNEEQNLPTLLRSLAAQAIRPCEIIVVNDASTDRTAEVARAFGARVIHSQPLPDGWRGKTWACHQGAQAATGDLLLFLDADTWFEPDGLARVLTGYAGLVAAARQTVATCALEEMRRSGETPLRIPAGAFSVGPFHAVQNPYEHLSLFFNFNMTVGTVPDGLFGQMLLVDRNSYRLVGGHEAVKGRTLENFFLAQEFRAAGVPTLSATGRGVFAFRMYPNGLHELIEGWTKGFAAGAGQTPRGVLFLVVVWMIGLMLAPLGWAVTGDALAWGAAYLLCAAQVAWFARQIGGFRWFAALLYPVPLVFFFAVFTRSAMRSGKQVTWKGRQIRAD